MYKTVNEIIQDHLYSCVLSFHVEEGEGEYDPHNCSVEKLQTPGRAEVCLKPVCPYCSTQPEESEGDGAVGAEYEEEAEAEDEAADGAKFIEEVDCCGDARGHFCDVGERSSEAAAIVHQGPGDVKTGESHG